MASRKTAPLDAGLLVRKGAAAPAVAGTGEPKFIALTVKVTEARYRQLKQIALHQTPATTMQQLIIDALSAHYGEPDKEITDGED